MAHKNNNNLVGIGFMVSGMFALVLMDAVAKWLVEANISPVQVLAIRSWIIVSVILLVLLTGKRLTEQDSITSLVFSFNLMISVVSTLLLPLVWIPVSLTIVSILLLLAFLALCGHYLLTIAFSKAQISAAIIIASGLYVIHRESMYLRVK